MAQWIPVCSTWFEAGTTCNIGVTVLVWMLIVFPTSSSFLILLLHVCTDASAQLNSSVCGEICQAA